MSDIFHSKNWTPFQLHASLPCLVSSWCLLSCIIFSCLTFESESQISLLLMFLHGFFFFSSLLLTLVFNQCDRQLNRYLFLLLCNSAPDFPHCLGRQSLYFSKLTNLEVSLFLEVCMMVDPMFYHKASYFL